MRYLIALTALLLLGFSGVAVAAPQTNSSHFQVNEVQIGGAGSAQKLCGSTYCGKISVGDLVAGSASSDTYSAQLGFNTSDTPLLEVMALGGTSEMGTIDTGKTGTATNIIKVRSYLSSGYTLHITGAPPTALNHTLSVPMGEGDTPFTSQPGSEQFGINLVANNTPHIGADPVQVPSGSFSFGTVADGYDQADLFKYRSGDTMAYSNRSTGETDYTVSMIINVSGTTPGGKYTSNFSAVVVPNF